MIIEAFSPILPDPLQRFTFVKVEATSFTVSEPFSPMTVAPLLFEKATAEQRITLKDQYDVYPFHVNTIRLERIFVDKIFASEFYYQRNEYSDVSKHIYDLAVMSGLDEIRRLLSDPVELTSMMAYKRREEKVRIGSDLSEKPVSDFTVFGMNEDELRESFVSMQNIYVFDDRDKIEVGDVLASLSSIREHLLSERL